LFGVEYSIYVPVGLFVLLVYGSQRETIAWATSVQGILTSVVTREKASELIQKMQFSSHHNKKSSQEDKRVQLDGGTELHTVNGMYTYHEVAH